MEGLAIIEGKELAALKERLTNIEQNQLAIIKLVQQLVPAPSYNAVPDFISAENAAKKYKVSKTTIYNKINLFNKSKGREIDRLQSGSYNLVNEIELLEALRMKSPAPTFFKKNKD